jgi:alpha-galactosidase
MTLTFFPSIFLLLATVPAACTLDNGEGALPLMGFTTWDAFGCRDDMNETSVRAVIDLMVSSGLRDVGYEYVNLDDCWQQREANGTLVADPARFPSGIAALADYAHAAGMKLGLYTDVGTKTCAGHPGSWGFEEADAAAYASWGVDFVKEDHCNLPDPLPPGIADENAFYNYALGRMRDALNATGRRVFFDLCAHTCYGDTELHSPACWAQWYANATRLGNSRRTTTDACHTWASVMNNWYRNDAFQNGTLPLAQFSGPFSWNDPDALQIGNLGAPRGDNNDGGGGSVGDGVGSANGGAGNGGGGSPAVTAAMEQTHFSAWCIMGAPLVLGTELTPAVLALASNAEAVAVDQDPLGVQGVRVHVAGDPVYSHDVYGDGLVWWPQEVWAKPLASGARAVLVVNHAATAAAADAAGDDDKINDDGTVDGGGRQGSRRGKGNGGLGGGGNGDAEVVVSLEDIARVYPPAMPVDRVVEVYDLWAHKVVGNITVTSGQHRGASNSNRTWTVKVPPQTSRFLRLTAI